MQGNCQESFPNLSDVPSTALGPALRPQKPGQCLLSGFRGRGIMLSSPQGFPIWLDNLYLRVGGRQDLLPQEHMPAWATFEQSGIAHSYPIMQTPAFMCQASNK